MERLFELKQVQHQFQFNERGRLNNVVYERRDVSLSHLLLHITVTVKRTVFLRLKTVNTVWAISTVSVVGQKYQAKMKSFEASKEKLLYERMQFEEVWVYKMSEDAAAS